MSYRDVLGVTLLLGLSTSVTFAQPIESQVDEPSRQEAMFDELSIQELKALLEGIPVRPSEDIGFADRLLIVLNHAFIQRPNIATLHAYDPEVACENAHLRPLLGHSGSAAILYTWGESDGGDAAFAMYRPTVTDAVVEARREDWCNNRTGWYFATTHPLDGTVAGRHKPKDYFSWDVDLIENTLRAFESLPPAQRLEELYESIVPAGTPDPDADPASEERRSSADVPGTVLGDQGTASEPQRD